HGSSLPTSDESRTPNPRPWPYYQTPWGRVANCRCRRRSQSPTNRQPTPGVECQLPTVGDNGNRRRTANPRPTPNCQPSTIRCNPTWQRPPAASRGLPAATHDARSPSPTASSRPAAASPSVDGQVRPAADNRPQRPHADRPPTPHNADYRLQLSTRGQTANARTTGLSAATCHTRMTRQFSPNAQLPTPHHPLQP